MTEIVGYPDSHASSGDARFRLNSKNPGRIRLLETTHGVSRMRKCLNYALTGALFFLLGPMPVFAQTAIPPNAAMALPAGVLNLACTNLDLQGSVVLGTSQIDQSGTVTIAASGVLDGGQGTIVVGGDWINSGSFIPGTGTVVFSDVCGSGGGQLSGDTTFNNLTFTSTTGKPFVIPAGSHITVTGTLLLQGTAGDPLQLNSSSGQTAYIALGPNAQVTYDNAQVAPNVQIGALAPTAIPALDGHALLLLSFLLAATVMVKGFPRLRKTARSNSKPAR